MSNREDEVPKVSVCVITYNQVQYIRQCLESIVSQVTTFPFEVIVADDCSTDGTRRIVEEFASRYPGVIRTIFQAANTGGSINFQQVHAAAVGTYVAHVDGDDFMLPSKLELQASVLDNDPCCTAVWHRVDYIDDHGGSCSGLTADLSVFAGGHVEFADAIRLGFVGAHSALMYRRVARMQEYSDEPVLDMFYTWDLLSKGRGFFIDAVLGVYRMAASGSLSLSSRKRISAAAVAHARYFVRKYPEQKRNFFIWSARRFLMRIARLDMSALRNLAFCVECFSFVNPWEVVRAIRQLSRIQVKWADRAGAD